MNSYISLNSRRYCCGGGTQGRLGVEPRLSHILKKCPIVSILVFSIAFIHVYVMNKSPGMWFELLCPSVSGIPAKNTDPYSNSFRTVSSSLRSLQAVLIDPAYEDVVAYICHRFSRPTSIVIIYSIVTTHSKQLSFTWKEESRKHVLQRVKHAIRIKNK